MNTEPRILVKQNVKTTVMMNTKKKTISDKRTSCNKSDISLTRT